MTIETHIIKGERESTEDMEAGDFYGGRDEQAVARDLSERYTEIAAQGGSVIASHTILTPRNEENLYLVVDYPSSPES